MNALERLNATPVSPRLIVEIVAARHGYTTWEMVGPSRAAPLVEARMIAMWTIRELTTLSLADIGLALGGRDKATASHAIDTVAQRRVADREVAEGLMQIKLECLGQTMANARACLPPRRSADVRAAAAKVFAGPRGATQVSAADIEMMAAFVLQHTLNSEPVVEEEAA